MIVYITISTTGSTIRRRGQRSVAGGESGQLTLHCMDNSVSLVTSDVEVQRVGKDRSLLIPRCLQKKYIERMRQINYFRK